MAKKRKTFKKIQTEESAKPSILSHVHRLFVLSFLSIFFLLLPGQNIYSQMVLEEIVQDEVFSQNLFTPAPIPVNMTGLYPDYITAEGVYLEDMDSAMVLFERNANAKMAPASTTKMITALVALDVYSPDDVVEVKTVVTEGRVMGLQEGEKITVENLLYGILIHSGNDAAYALAEHYPDGVDGFVVAMNEKAYKLYLANTFFTNPIGFDGEKHFSTPRDLARLAKVVLSNKTLSKMVGIPNITVSDATYSIFHPLTNVNELVGRIPGVSGVKTGFTKNAGESLITVAQRNDHQVLIVILNSQDRFFETEQLINWVFTNYQWQEIMPSA